MRSAFIYALCEPGTRTVRYIGKSVEPERRFRLHLSDSIKFKSYLGNWLRSLKGQKPNKIILSEVPEEKGSEEEMRYIAAAKVVGCKLVNATDGGEGVTMTPEIRAKISASKTPELKEALRIKMTGEGNHNFGKRLPKEQIEAMIKSKIGVPLSPTHCAAISKALKGLPRSPEHCAALSAAHTGQKRSPEQCASMSAARVGKPLSPAQAAHLKRMSANNLGTKRGPYKKQKARVHKPLSPAQIEHLKRMSANNLGKKRGPNKKRKPLDKEQKTGIF